MMYNSVHIIEHTIRLTWCGGGGYGGLWFGPAGPGGVGYLCG